ncbi:MAG TPA: M23 family metallopeptidase [Dokdonella sp.]|nr:M23 family metallopeptidase [Dokdonella sp.]
MRNRLLPLAFAAVFNASAAVASPPAGGGPFELPRDALTAGQRARIDAELQRNVEALQRDGTLAPTAPFPPPLQGGLQWPLRKAAGNGDPGYHGISNFVDLDGAYPSHLLDWNCGARTYDLASGNHAGIDIFLWPFSWLQMDTQAVDIVAAAPGTIIGKVDGNDDRSCPDHYSADWNAVYVQHADGTVAWYGHMKKFSQTGKPVGATVAAGEFLGKVGSAGFSTGPHLHFENHSGVPNYTILEPFHGACNAPASLWAQQRPYYDSAINKLATHAAPPTSTIRTVRTRSTRRPTCPIASRPAQPRTSPRTTAISSARSRPRSRSNGRTARASRAGRSACPTARATRTTPRRTGTGGTRCPQTRRRACGTSARPTRALRTRTRSSSAT